MTSSSFSTAPPASHTRGSMTSIPTTSSTTTLPTSPTATNTTKSLEQTADNSRATQSTSNETSSPLPAVLPSPPRSSSATNTTTSITSAVVATTATRSPIQLNSTQSQPAPSQCQGLVASSSALVATTDRILNTGSRRQVYPSSSLMSPYNGGTDVTSPTMHMQGPYFGTSTGSRVTTRPSSHNHNHHSPVSSPAMTGESWAQNAPAGTSTATRSLKRHLPQQYNGSTYETYGANPRMPPQQPPNATNASLNPPSTATTRRGPTSLNGANLAEHGSATTTPRHRSTAPLQPLYGAPPSEDPMQYEPLGEARHPRDSTRYETWTSKQLRKKCSHLKLRGLKNVKKHVMVEALYRYYRNQRLKDMADAASADKTSHGGGGRQPTASPSPQRRMELRRSVSIGGNSMPGMHSDMQYRSRFDQRSAGAPSQQSHYGSSRSRSYGTYRSRSPSPPSSGGDSGHLGGPTDPSSSGFCLTDEVKGEALYKEVPVTSEDVIRLVDVVLSQEFVDRLAAELSRWQFWVDVREMYIALLSRQHRPGSGGNGKGGPVGSGGSATNSRNFKWSSMQLWEIWKELTFAYTKTCFEFTSAGMNKRADEHEYINFCEGRPDVYYLHQRLHARPDLLHLIKSNEYIDEKCTSEASKSIAHEQQQAQQNQQVGPLIGSGSPMIRNHKRYKRSTPTGPTMDAYNSARAIAAFRDGASGVDDAGFAGGRTSGETGHSPEENSTENSETTGEEGSNSNTANSNSSKISQDVSMRAALAEQKYFGLLLQNFEVIFESLHNKKVLLATLRKDSKAPDHLIADLHDDIHVLSALKKEFRNKLRRTI